MRFIAIAAHMARLNIIAASLLRNDAATGMISGGPVQDVRPIRNDTKTCMKKMVQKANKAAIFIADLQQD